MNKLTDIWTDKQTDPFFEKRHGGPANPRLRLSPLPSLAKFNSGISLREMQDCGALSLFHLSLSSPSSGLSSASPILHRLPLLKILCRAFLVGSCKLARRKKKKKVASLVCFRFGRLDDASGLLANITLIVNIIVISIIILLLILLPLSFCLLAFNPIRKYINIRGRRERRGREGNGEGRGGEGNRGERRRGRREDRRGTERRE